MALIITGRGKKSRAAIAARLSIYILLFYQNLHPNVMIGNLSSFDIA